MKIVKILLLSIAVIVAIFAIAFGIYLIVNTQKTAEPFEAVFGEGEARVLFATQGSNFKDALSAEVLSLLEGQSLYLKGIDISQLADVDPDRWDAFVLIHTTERWKLPKAIEGFLARVDDEKIVQVITSGSGEWVPESWGIDAITSASKDEEITPVAREIVERVKEIVRTGHAETTETPPINE
ncbi:MAG TPA: hypothetical protein ENN07_02325 [candidate division Zixibacteria bacterium]|nr:hypothetical protein [candidate division Zixibacteria bacterium]